MKHYNPNLSGGEPVKAPPAGSAKAVESRPQPEFLRVRDIVRPHGVLPIGKSTWHLWVKQGKAPAGTRLGGVTLWSRAAVMALATGEAHADV